MFVSAYIQLNKMEGQTIFKDFNYGGSSLLMINNGDNTFCGVLVDIDNDAFLDLIVAHDTGEVRTYKNENGKNFTNKNNPTTGISTLTFGLGSKKDEDFGEIEMILSDGSTINLKDCKVNKINKI